MRPAFALYAEYLEGTTVEDLARKHGLRWGTVAKMLGGARLCLKSDTPRLLPAEANRFRKRAA